MAQLSLYMDDVCMDKLRADAESEGISISAYARCVLERRHESPRGWVNGWPPHYFESLKPLDFELPSDPPPEPIAPLGL